ncbi:MAG: sugar ABC transporter substrate-binding protein [Bacillus thermozeamaize]|uniref:Sugar ABC transporter substrate-binding protein n=1 Tax=Bacillus thermozeamaize TaxID=230954 RepID=A0A1Y3PH12_9BACI|nr:MAG: sugar ABC transporter substrate-binding protein [Bacillus thermozeamaize]
MVSGCSGSKNDNGGASNSGSSGNTANSGASASDKPYAGVKIRALMEGHPTSEALLEMLPEFEAETGIKVELEIVPYSDLTSKALLNFASKTGAYDIVMDDVVKAYGYENMGYIEPLDSYISNPELNRYYDGSDFVPQYLNAMMINGKQYGLPVYGESTFLMYRKDLFEEYGIEVPTTFEELEEAAKTVYEKSGGKIAGITLRGEQGIQNVYVWAGFLWGFGGQWFDENGRSVINSPEAVEALETYARLLRNYGPQGVANFGWQENRLLFQQGQAAMTIDATVNGAYNEDPSESNIVGKVGYAPVPVKAGADLKGGSSSLAVHGLFLASDSKNKEAAWLFMSWATAKEQQIKSFQIAPNAGVSSLAAMETPEFAEKYGAFKDGMLEAIANGNIEYLPQVPESNEIINNTGIAISKALFGQDAKAALDEANDLNNKAMGK